jgi:hypothetical protein
MKPIRLLALAMLLIVTGLAAGQGKKAAVKVREQSFTAANDLTIKVRVAKPQDLDTDLQILGYFKHETGGDTTLAVIVDFDKMLGGVIAALRNRGEFAGNELETLAFTPPTGVMKPKKILLVGYGPKVTFSKNALERVGTVAIREAIRLRAARVAFAPALFDQGFEKMHAEEVAQHIIPQVILAYDTEKRLQKEGFAREFSIDAFVMEAGPEHFKDVVAGVTKGIKAAKADLAARSKAPFSKK